MPYICKVSTLFSIDVALTFPADNASYSLCVLICVYKILTTFQKTWSSTVTVNVYDKIY